MLMLFIQLRSEINSPGVPARRAGWRLCAGTNAFVGCEEYAGREPLRLSERRHLRGGYQWTDHEVDKNRDREIRELGRHAGHLSGGRQKYERYEYYIQSSPSLLLFFVCVHTSVRVHSTSSIDTSEERIASFSFSFM